MYTTVLTYLRAGTTFAARVTAGLTLEQSVAKLTQQLINTKAELEMTRDLAAPLLMLGSTSASDAQLPLVMSQFVMDDVGSSSCEPPWPIE